MSFAGLDQDSDTSTKDYTFRADVKISGDGDAEVCEDRAGGYGLGVDRYMWKVDEDPESRTGTISASCPVGAYTLRASISDADGEELASARAAFTVVDPSPPASPDATLSGLTLSGVSFGTFDSATTSYAVAVGNDVVQTTVTATTNHKKAAYKVKLGGVADGDGTVSLAVGENVITVEVTAEGGQTTKTYTVTVTRAAPPSTDASLSALALRGVDFGTFNSATTSYTASVANDVAQTTVTATANDDGATYVVKLDGTTNTDETVALAVGENVVSVQVTAEDGETTRTYAVTVTRAEADNSGQQSQQYGPTASLTLSETQPVLAGTAITVTMSFSGLESDSDGSTRDYTFRADVKDSQGTDADTCEDNANGYGLGVDRYMNKVDEDPETRTGTISADCPAGDYTVETSISTDGSQVASASAGFTVKEPPSTDATLSSLSLTGVDIGTFAPDTTAYTASVAKDVDETTVTPNMNDDWATYEVKLDGTTDADGTVSLAVGSNVITVEVTAEDGQTTRT